MSYLRGAFGETRWERESNERYDISTCTNGMNCGVVEWVKINILKWFGHVWRMGSKEL